MDLKWPRVAQRSNVGLVTHWGRNEHFADNIFKRIFFNEHVWILMKISLKFVPKGSVNDIPALVQIMAWRRSGDKPLSEPMMVSLPTHICVTQPQWVNNFRCSQWHRYCQHNDINVSLYLTDMNTEYLEKYHTEPKVMIMIFTISCITFSHFCYHIYHCIAQYFNIFNKCLLVTIWHSWKHVCHSYVVLNNAETF